MDSRTIKAVTVIEIPRFFGYASSLGYTFVYRFEISFASILNSQLEIQVFSEGFFVF